MSQGNERSAEFLRGWLEGAEDGVYQYTKDEEMLQAMVRANEQLLAAAEAREAGERAGAGTAKNSGQVIEKASAGGGVGATQPTAAEVLRRQPNWERSVGGKPSQLGEAGDLGAQALEAWALWKAFSRWRTPCEFRS